MSVTPWDFASLDSPNVFPRSIRRTGLGRLDRGRKWRLRTRLTRYMVKEGLRCMNSHYAHTRDEAAARDTVGMWELLEIVRAADRHGIIGRSRHGLDGWITLDDYELKAAAKAAARALEANWTPAFIETVSLGGRVSRRPPTFTLDDYGQVQHMTHRRAAEALGCSLSTIKRLAAQTRAAGSLIKAKALDYARRARRVILPSFGRVQITRAWAGLETATGDPVVIEKGRPPP